MTDRRRIDLKLQPTAALLDRALVSYKDSGSEWQERSIIVATLQMRGDRETFRAAKSWCASADATERELAADLLTQFGARVDENDGSCTFRSAHRTVPLLEKLIGDPEARVIASAVHGLGWHGAFDLILARPSLARHSSSWVRFAVACALKGSESKAAIEILIALAQDDDDEVRDRANWALHDSRIDTPEIREVLFRNVRDRQVDTRCEAMVGLARRKDARVIPHIQEELAADSVYYVAIEAAGHIASSGLVKSLERLRSCSDTDKELLERALNRCKDILDPDDDEPWVKDNEIIVPTWATEDSG